MPLNYSVGIIPARWASSRFPGKPLHLLNGKPLLQHVCERASLCQELAEVMVATDDERIQKAAAGWGSKVAMTSPDHESGTDRIAEALSFCSQATHVFNLQGDEPLLDPGNVDCLVRRLIEEPELEMITAATLMEGEEQVADPNIVKVVLNNRGRALYFSRAAIPYPRGGEGAYYRHHGLYGFRRNFLENFVTWPPSSLEKTEGLEQLRALENGASIQVEIVEHESIGLDVPEQVSYIEELLKKQKTH